MSKPRIVIINYGAGNLRSVEKMLEYVGANVGISSSPKDLAHAGGLILPGVGHVGAAMSMFRAAGFEAPLRDAILQDVPLLGLCVGAQMMLTWSEEGNAGGLDLIPGMVRRFDTEAQGLKVPNVGWRVIRPTQTHRLVSDATVERYYFMHSYKMNPSDAKHVLATSAYGSDYASVIGRDSIFGVQFHPEKSHVFGKAFFRRFLAICSQR